VHRRGPYSTAAPGGDPAGTPKGAEGGRGGTLLPKEEPAGRPGVNADQGGGSPHCMAEQASKGSTSGEANGEEPRRRGVTVHPPEHGRTRTESQGAPRRGLCGTTVARGTRESRNGPGPVDLAPAEKGVAQRQAATARPVRSRTVRSGESCKFAVAPEPRGSGSLKDP